MNRFAKMKKERIYKLFETLSMKKERIYTLFETLSFYFGSYLGLISMVKIVNY